MDKQQASEHILKRLRAGYNQEEIADELSRILKAPVDLAGKFVRQVAASHPEAVPPAPPPPAEETLDDRPEWLQNMAGGASSAASYDLPPGLTELINEGVPPQSQDGYSSQFEANPSGSGYPSQAAAFETQYPKERAEIKPAAEDIPGVDDQAQKVDLEALTELVFKQLAGHKRFNDVVVEVCRQTGWHWNKAQRFVARVQTEHHSELNKKQNQLLVPIGLVFIIGGLFLMFYTGASLLDWIMFATGNESVSLDLPSVPVQGIPQTMVFFGTGVLLVTGGVIGIVQAIRNRE